MTREEKIKVGVLCGGFSSERAVSLKSGGQVTKFLPREKYVVTKINLTREGRWLAGKRSLVIFHKKRGVTESELKKFDVIFIALHGKFGEDGRIQSLLEIIGVPYTGSGVIASALGMDKMRTNYLVRNIVRIPKTINQSGLPSKKNALLFHQALRKKIGAPYIVKPNDSGSSVGTTIVKKASQLRSAITSAFKESDAVLIQEYVGGRELTCGVLGNSGEAKLIALPPVEIITSHQFFDYQAKYSSETREICPAPISKKLTKEIQELSKKVHAELGCDGLTRCDFILTPQSKLYFLEINTIPGLTENSLCPKEARAAGMSFSEFLDRQIELALRKKS